MYKVLVIYNIGYIRFQYIVCSICGYVIIICIYIYVYIFYRSVSSIMVLAATFQHPQQDVSVSSRETGSKSSTGPGCAK